MLIAINWISPVLACACFLTVSAEAKAVKPTPKARVTDAFTELQKHPWEPRRPSPFKGVTIDQKGNLVIDPHQEVRLTGRGVHGYDRSSWYFFGKLYLIRLCQLDLRTDPGENSCRIVEAHI